MRENIKKLIKRYKGKIEWLEEHTENLHDRHTNGCIVTYKSIVVDLEDLLIKENYKPV